MRIQPWNLRRIARYFLVVLMVVVIVCLSAAYTADKQRLRSVAGYNRWIFDSIGERCLGIWHFEEDGGSEVADLCETMKDGVMYGANRVGGAAGGKAIKLSDGDYVALGAALTEPTLKRFSACVWFKTNVTCRGHHCNGSLLDFDREQFFSLYVNGDGRVGFSSFSEKNGVNDMYSLAQLNDNRWHLTCAVYDGLDKKIYIDGQLDNIQNNAHEQGLIGSDITRYGFLGVVSLAQGFNDRHGDSYYNGMIDDVRIYKEAIPLTATSGSRLACGS